MCAHWDIIYRQINKSRSILKNTESALSLPIGQSVVEICTKMCTVTTIVKYYKQKVPT